jgi:hypothetical protein
MRQGDISEFEQGRIFGRQEILITLLNNSKLQQFKEGDFCVTLDTIQKLLNGEAEQNGKAK